VPAFLPALTAALVAFDPDVEVLAEVATRLLTALRRAAKDGVLAGAQLLVVDNGPRPECEAKLDSLLARHWDATAFPFTIITGHGNIGYGLGHNKAIAQSRTDYHLILNPDVLLAEDAIANAIAFMEHNPDVGLLAPAVIRGGELQHLCKDRPAVLDLALRGFAPSFIKTLARRRLARYELRQLDSSQVHCGVPLVSGSFMFFRRRVLELTGGFSKDYFLYFEDFDLSLRAAQFGAICYVPSVRIEHKGGFAGKKGPKHWWMFGRSAYTFFSQHGWRWY
jgi:GT2 family glycosyltransferase